MSVRATAKKHHIPKITLLNKITGKYLLAKRIGDLNYFISEQKEILKSRVINLALRVLKLAQELGVKFLQNSSDLNKNIYLLEKKMVLWASKKTPTNTRRSLAEVKGQCIKMQV